MAYSIAAELVLGLHLAFVVFAVLGGLAIPRHPWVAWLHVPTVVWAAWVNLAGWVCPLTPLESRLRRMAGQQGYEGTFLEAMLAKAIYSQDAVGLSSVAVGALLALWTVGVYAWVWRRTGRRAA